MFAVQLPRGMAFVSFPKAQAFIMPDTTFYQFPLYHGHAHRRLRILRYAIPDVSFFPDSCTVNDINPCNR